jgi:hypothetical protein
MFLLVLAIGTALPMLVGLVFVRVVSHTDGIAVPSVTQPRQSIEVVPERDERRHSESWEVYSTVIGPGGYERLTESDIEDELAEASVTSPFLHRSGVSRERTQSETTDREVELSPSRRQSESFVDRNTIPHRHSRSRSRSMVQHHEHVDVHGWGLLKNSEFWNLFLVMCCCKSYLYSVIITNMVL